MDRDRARRDDRDHRGAPAGRARAPLPGGGAGRRRAPPAADVRDRTRRRAAAQPRGRPPRRRRRPRPAVRGAGRGSAAAHAAAGRDRRAARRRADAAGDRASSSAAPGCDQAVEQCLAAGLRLTDPDERDAHPRASPRRKTAGLADDDLDVLGYDEWLAGLEAGFAAHHAGMVPPMKEAVEEAFAAGLVKVVFATETLSLGINMPARSVVIEKLSKFTGEHHEFLTPGGVHPAHRARRAARHRRRRVRGRAAGARSCPSTRSPALASRRT